MPFELGAARAVVDRDEEHHRFAVSDAEIGARLMEKLDLHETAALVRYAIRHGIIDA